MCFKRVLLFLKILDSQINEESNKNEFACCSKRDTEYYSKHVCTEHTHRVHKYTSIKHAKLFIEKVYGN